MTPNEIQAAIIKAGTNQKAIAEYLGINVHMVWRVVNGMGRSARVEAELIKIIGYDIFGGPASRGPKKKVWTGQVIITKYPSAEAVAA